MLVAITGASGVHLATEFIHTLHNKKIDFELIISKNAKKVIELETDDNILDIIKFAKETYDIKDLTAAPASGSYIIDKMIIIPCSMKTLSAIANGYCNNLITRAADVNIKEKRRLVLVVRETPFSAIHLENMLKLARLGVTIFPPIPSYYHKPKTIEDIMNHTIGRILDQFNIKSDITRWKG